MPCRHFEQPVGVWVTPVLTALDSRPNVIAPAFGDDHIERSSNDLVGGPAEEPSRRRVPDGDDAAAVADDDGIRGDADEGGQRGVMSLSGIAMSVA